MIALKRTCLRLIACSLVGSLSSQAFAIRYYVNGSVNNSGNGQSWGAAFKTLQEALGAMGSGDETWVADGTYRPDQGGTPGDKAATFTIGSNEHVFGGFAGTETTLAQRDIFTNVTILSGDLSDGDDPEAKFGGDPDTYVDNSEHVVTMGGAAENRSILNGCVIEGGHAVATPNSFGAGIYMTNDCGIVNCTLRYNRSSTGYGGAAWVQAVDDFAITFVSCTLHHNMAHRGGAIAMNDDVSGDNEFRGLYVVNCLLYSNVALNDAGSAIYLQTSDLLDIRNCTFSDNSPGTALTTIRTGINCIVNVLSTIVWDHGSSTDILLGEDTVPDFDSNCLQEAVVLTEGSVTPVNPHNFDPYFVDPSSGDYHLDPSSSTLFDQGTNDSLYEDVFDVDDDEDYDENSPDLDRSVRLWACDGTVDIGAYEFKSHCALDLNDDTYVNGLDLADLLAEWGESPGGPPNFDCRGEVDGQDLALLLGGWTGGASYPRQCSDSLLGGGGEPEGEEYEALLSELGLEDHDEFVAWLGMTGVPAAVAIIQSIMNP